MAVGPVSTERWVSSEKQQLYSLHPPDKTTTEAALMAVGPVSTGRRASPS